MSYRSDREKMRKDAAEHRKKVLFITKITFFAFAALLVVFCATLGLSKLFGWGNGARGEDTVPPVVSQNFDVSGFDKQGKWKYEHRWFQVPEDFEDEYEEINIL